MLFIGQYILIEKQENKPTAAAYMYSFLCLPQRAGHLEVQVTGPLLNL